ncbi:MAG TPA: hypothetical protein VE442_14940 [Jatrophihabitans sp.]|nr:hypothetical protein [Jatrophihabitans sp.]
MRTPRHFVLPVAAALVSFFAVATPAHAATAYTWIGSSGNSGGDNHSWTDPNNWSPTGVPGTGDSASIAPPDASHCVAHVDNVPTVSLAGFSLAQPPAFCGASVNGGQLTVTGVFAWNGGTLSTPTSIAAGASGTISGSDGRLNTLAADLDLGGSLTLSGIVDNGSSNAGGFRIITDSDGARVLHVLAGGTLISDGANAVQPLACCVNPAKIVNDGTLEVDSGDLVVHGVQVDQNGTLAATSGGRLVSDAAPLTAANGATYSGSGGWLIEDGATAHISGTQTLGSGFHLELGGLNVNAGARLGGTATLTGAGEFDWTGGTVEGSITIAHGMTMNASGAHTDNGHRFLSGSDGTASGPAVPSTFTNHGTITFDQGAGVLTGSQATLVNAQDGTLNLAPGTQVTTVGCCVNPNKIVNHGHVSVPTDSSADPVVLDGVAYQSDGVTSIAAGRTLEMSVAPSSLTSTIVSGGGTLAVAAPTAVSGTITVGGGTTLALQPTHGSLDGTATIAGAGSMDWTGGRVTGNVTVSVGGGMAIGGPDGKYVSNVGGGSTPSKLTLTTPVSIAAGTSALHDYVSIEGNSTLTLGKHTTVGNYTEIYSGKLVNAGSLEIQPGASGTVLRSGPLTNRGTVTIDSGTFKVNDDYTQTAGATHVDAGTHLDLFSVSRTLTLGGGVLDGAGTVGASVSNTGGSVEPAGTGTGTLHISGAYSQGKQGVLALTLGAHGHDLLAVAGAVTLHGKLTAHDAGSYHPHAGTKVKVLSAPAVTYLLTCATTSGTGSTSGHWAPTHTSTGVSLTWREGAHTHC